MLSGFQQSQGWQPICFLQSYYQRMSEDVSMKNKSQNKLSESGDILRIPRLPLPFSLPLWAIVMSYHGHCIMYYTKINRIERKYRSVWMHHFIYLKLQRSLSWENEIQFSLNFEYSEVYFGQHAMRGIAMQNFRMKGQIILHVYVFKMYINQQMQRVVLSWNVSQLSARKKLDYAIMKSITWIKWKRRRQISATKN